MSSEDDVTVPAILRSDIETPAETIARLSAELDLLKHPPLANEISAEIKFSPSRKHLLFKFHGPFWSTLFAFGWAEATRLKKAQLITGAVTFQGGVIAAYELVRRHLPGILHALAGHVGQ